MPDEMVRVHVWVQGLVQNVGFRAYVEYSAHQLDVTGWVRNVRYDTVEAVAEGKRGKVDRFVEAMKAGPRASRVNESKVEWENATGEFKEFGVRRSV
jgi:acylphosphatase